MTARALCSVLVLAMGLYFVIGALAFLPGQFATYTMVSVMEAHDPVTAADPEAMKTVWQQGSLALLWQLLVGVVIIALRNNIATAFVPLDDDYDEDYDEYSSATATELRAIGVFLIGIYLLATGISQILPAAAVDRTGEWYTIYGPYLPQTVIGLLFAIWGYRALSPTASRSDDDDWDDADYEPDDVVGE